MSENNENDLVVLPGPPSLPLEFKTLDGWILNDLNALRDFLDSDCDSGETKRVFWNRTNQVASDFADRYVNEYDFSLGIVGRTKWRINFYDIYAQGGKQHLGTFVAFTGIVDVVLDKEKQAALSSFIVRTAAEHEHEDPPLLIEGYHNGIVYVFGYMVDTTRALITKEEVRFSNLEQVGIDHFCHWKHMWPKWAEYTLEAFPLNDQNKEPEVSEQQASPAEQESDGTTPVVYYTRHGLSMLLQETADPADLINVEKFIDDQLSAWSKHLALNTHKKQTEKTPRFSIHEGPGIIAILLDRGDLEFGERAPQLQMIFSDTENGISITARQQGGMTTSRMLDAFDQILTELNSGKRVPFRLVDSLVTFVDHVSNHADSLAFREAVGDPMQALILNNIENPDVTFYMYRKPAMSRIVVEAHFDRADGSEPYILFTILLVDVGQQGNLMLMIAEDSPTQPLAKNIERVEEASKEDSPAQELSEMWQEVRTIADEVVETATELAEVQASVQAGEAAQDPSVTARPIRNLKEVLISGDDEYLLEHFIERALRSTISLRHSRALKAFKSFVLDGEGLAHLDHWSYLAAITPQRTQAEEDFLTGDNNTYILIFNEKGRAKDTAILTFQCRLDAADGL